MSSSIQLHVTFSRSFRGNPQAWKDFHHSGVRQALQRVGDAVKPILQRRAFAWGAVWKERFMFGWFYRTKTTGDETSLTIDNHAKHAIFVEKGRRAGARPPPVRAIEEWVRDKLGPDVSPFLVARSIGKKGIKPKPVLTSPETQRDITNLVIYAVERAISQKLREQP